MSWPSPDHQNLARAAIAVRTNLAATILLRELQRSGVEGGRELERLEHVAKYLDADHFDELVQVATQMESPSPFAVYQIVRQHPAANRRHQAFRTWTTDLASKLFAAELFSSPDWRIESGNNSWGLESRRTTDGRRVPTLSSLPGGERQVSRIVSHPFVVPPQLDFELCGHRGHPRELPKAPGEFAGAELSETISDNFVQLRLLDSDRIVRRAYAPRSDVAHRISWDLTPYQGQQAVIDVVDQVAANAFAWIAVSQFEPQVVSVEGQHLGMMAQHQEMAIKMIEAGDLRSQLARLRHWAVDGIEPSIRAAAAKVWLRLSGKSEMDWLAALLASDAMPRRLRAELVHSLTDESTRLDRVVAIALRQQSPLQQQEIALQWAGTAIGARRLVDAMEQGIISVQLIRQEDVRSKLDARRDPELLGRIAVLEQDVPSETQAMAEFNLQAARNYDTTLGANAAAAGSELFKKHCVNCHQLGGVGKLVGPQLNGIGNRGLSRLIEDLFTPSRQVDPVFRTTVLSMSDGRVMAGLLRKNLPDEWELVDAKGEVTTVRPSDVVDQITRLASIMPDNFASQLTVAECNQLLTYLLRQR